jgi:hypothetical protein
MHEIWTLSRSLVKSRCLDYFNQAVCQKSTAENKRLPWPEEERLERLSPLFTIEIRFPSMAAWAQALAK